MSKQPKPATPAPQAPPATPAPGLPRLLLPALVLLVTLLAYAPMRQNGFVNWDDNAYIFENEQVGMPFGSALAYFWQLHFVLGSYTPLTMTVITALFHGWGADPAVFHTVSLLLHLVNVLLVFLLAQRLSGGSRWVAAMVALLFGVHPVHTESVMWAAELKDVLYAAFYLGGLLAYLRYTDGGGKLLRLLPCFGLFTLSLLAKPAAVTFPLALFLADYLRRRPFTTRLMLEKVPFLVLSAIFGVITLQGQASYVIMSHHHALPQRLVYAGYSIAVYVQKLLVPARLSIFHPYPTLAAWHYLTPLVAVALLWWAYRSRTTHRYITFGILFFFLHLALTLPFLSQGMSVLAEHYMYLAYLGLYYIIAMAVQSLVLAPQAQFARYRTGAVAGLCMVAVAFAGVTYARAAAWQNAPAMADDLERAHPADEVVLNNKGFLLYSNGNAQASVPYFIRALAQKPDYPFASVNLSNAYIALGNMDRALQVIDSGIMQMPAEYDVVVQRGYILILQKRYAEAIPTYEQAITLRPEKRNAYLGMAECYYQLHDYNRELALLDRGLQQLPGNYLLLNYKGYALMQQGRIADAVPVLEEALHYQPGFRAAANNLEECRRLLSGKK